MRADQCNLLLPAIHFCVALPHHTWSKITASGKELLEWPSGVWQGFTSLCRQDLRFPSSVKLSGKTQDEVGFKPQELHTLQFTLLSYCTCSTYRARIDMCLNVLKSWDCSPTYLYSWWVNVKMTSFRKQHAHKHAKRVVQSLGGITSLSLGLYCVTGDMLGCLGTCPTALLLLQI